MRPKEIELEHGLTVSEVKKIQEALREGGGGMVVIPLKDGRRLAPHLVPAKRNGELNRKALDLLAVRLRAIGCQAAVGVGERGRIRDVLAE